MSVFDTYGGTKAIKAEPKSVGLIYNNFERYEGKFNGKVKVIDVNKIEHGQYKGAILIHMQNARLKANGQEISDGFFAPSAKQSLKQWRKIQRDKIAGAMLSAGLKAPEKINLGTEGEKLLKKLIGKEVTISQFTNKGYSKPTIRYKFVSEDVEEPELDDEDDEDDEDEDEEEVYE